MCWRLRTSIWVQRWRWHSSPVAQSVLDVLGWLTFLLSATYGKALREGSWKVILRSGAGSTWRPWNLPAGLLLAVVVLAGWLLALPVPPPSTADHLPSCSSHRYHSTPRERRQVRIVVFEILLTWRSFTFAG